MARDIVALARVRLNQRALELGDILGYPARVLCRDGKVHSIQQCYKDSEQADHQEIVINSSDVGGREVDFFYVHAEDLPVYVQCCAMITAQETN